MKNTENGVVYENRNKKIQIDEMVDTASYKFVRLETREDVTIGSVDKILFADNHIIIMDKRIAESVFVFNFNGQFVGKIEQKGKGPGEYNTFFDIDVDAENKLIIINDVAQRKLIFYAFDGTYVKESHLTGNRGSYFRYLGADRYLFVCRRSGITSENHELLLIDSSGEILSTYFPLKNALEEELGVQVGKYFSSNNTFIPIGTDRLMRYGINGPEDVFCLSLKKYMLNRNDFKDYFNNKSFSKFGPIFNLNVTDNNIFFCQTSYETDVVTIIGDIESGKFISGILSFDPLKNGRCLALSVGSPISTYKTNFVSAVEPAYLKENYKREFIDVKVDDNPILLFYKFKDVKEIDAL